MDTPKKETQHVKKYNLLQIFNIILNKHYITLVVQILKFIKMANIFTLMSIAFR